MPAQASQSSELHVSGVELLVAGAQVSPEIRSALVDMKVTETLSLPASATIRITDPQMTHIDSSSLAIGKEVEVKMGAMSRALDRIDLQGRDRRDRAQLLGVRLRADPARPRQVPPAPAQPRGQGLAADEGVRHRLRALPRGRHRGLEQGDHGPVRVLHAQGRDPARADRPLRARLQLPLLARERPVQVPARRSDRRRGLAEAAREPGLLPPARVGRRRLDRGDRPRLGPEGQAGDHRPAVEPAGQRHEDLLHHRTPPSPHSRRAKVFESSRVLENTGEANALAKSLAERKADSIVEAEGTAFGNTALRAGCKVKVENVGTRFGGEYVMTSVTHQYNNRSGYMTHFRVSGASTRTLAGPDAPARAPRLEPGPGHRDRDQQQRPRPDGAREGQVPGAAEQHQRPAGEHLGADRGARRGQRPRDVHDAAGQRGGARRLRERRLPPPARDRLALQRPRQARDRPPAEQGRQLRRAVQREGPHALEEGLRDQERPEDGHRDQVGPGDQGPGQRQAGDHRQRQAQGRLDATRSSRAAR